MELRKCECGGNAAINAYQEDPESVPYSWDVYCQKCYKETKSVDTDSGAIQAWNEGKVE